MKMKGLLLKEWYVAREYCRSFLFIAAVFLIVSFWGAPNLFSIGYPVVIMSMVPITLIACDEKEKWNIYSEILPCTKQQLVIAKYLTGFIAVVVTVVLEEIIQAVRMTFAASFDMKAMMVSSVVLCAGGLFVPMLVLPLIYKFGAEKGRILYTGAIMIFCLVCMTIMKSGDVLKIFGNMNAKIPMGVFGAAVLVLYGISCRISIAFYKRREA